MAKLVKRLLLIGAIGGAGVAVAKRLQAKSDAGSAWQSDYVPEPPPSGAKAAQASDPIVPPSPPAPEPIPDPDPTPAPGPTPTPTPPPVEPGPDLPPIEPQAAGDPLAEPLHEEPVAVEAEPKK